MKITLTRNTRDHQLRLSTKTVEKLLERIAQDDAKGTITKFRHHLQVCESSFIETENMKTWLRIYPAAEFEKDANNNLVLKQSNGLLLLTFKNITKERGVAEAKKAVSILPTTFAAIEGVDSTSIHIWVKYADKNGLLPSNEDDAELLYKAAFSQATTIYRALTNAKLDDVIPSIRNSFLIIVVR